MGHNEIELNALDYFLLGMLTKEANGTDQLPFGCTDEQAERLGRAGYLERAVARAADGQQLIRYRITAKGRAKWQAYRFIEDPPDDAETE